MKIDKRKNLYMILDTETAPIQPDRKDVSPFNMLAYNVGYCVIDKKGNVYKTADYIISEIFHGEQQKMSSAYYNNKIPFYEMDIKNLKIKVKSFYEIKEKINKTIKDFNIKAVAMHNANFDFFTLCNTENYLNNTYNEYNFFNKIPIYDTLAMSRQIINRMPTYKQFCNDNNYKTKNNQNRLTAEILYRFISKNNEFQEQHTALSDCLIEKDIFTYCLKQHKKCDCRLFKNAEKWADFM